MHNNTTNDNDWNNFFIKAAKENIIVAKYILETFPDHIDEATVSEVFRISTHVNPNFAKSILQIAPNKVNDDIGIGFKDIFYIGIFHIKDISSSLLTTIAHYTLEKAYEYLTSDAKKADKNH